jgi:hypothetical protein
MKVKITPLPHINKNYGYEYWFEPVFDSIGEIIGYYYDNNGWYGIHHFINDLKIGVVTIIEDFKPKQELKKLSLI